jgi:hypothetical protein
MVMFVLVAAGCCAVRRAGHRLPPIAVASLAWPLVRQPHVSHIGLIPPHEALRCQPHLPLLLPQTACSCACQLRAYRTNAVAGRGAGAHGRENKTRCGTRCPGRQYLMSACPPVIGRQRITTVWRPGQVKSSVVRTGTWQGVTPTNSSSSSTAIPGGQLCTSMTDMGGPLGGGSGSGSGRVAQAQSASAEAARKRTPSLPSRRHGRRGIGIA